MEQAVLPAEEVLEDDSIEALQQVHFSLDEGEALPQRSGFEVNGVGQKVGHSESGRIYLCLEVCCALLLDFRNIPSPFCTKKQLGGG